MLCKSKYRNNKKCKRATFLHQETCSQTDESSSCSGAGYTTNGSKKTSTIIYGNCGNSGQTIQTGDAFDCDVNGDGIYDADTERFYYVSEYYNTTTKQFENDTAVLIYYNNTSGGQANNTATSAYHSGYKNYEGPVTAITQLPTTEQWSNINLKNTERAILNQGGGTTTGGGDNSLPTAYSYSGYAARLLTAQEVNAACNITTGNYTTGELDTCQYLMENTEFSSSSMGACGYWLEIPHSSNSNYVWSVYGRHRLVYYSSASITSYTGVRPAIEVSVTDIEY